MAFPGGYFWLFGGPLLVVVIVGMLLNYWFYIHQSFAVSLVKSFAASTNSTNAPLLFLMLGGGKSHYERQKVIRNTWMSPDVDWGVSHRAFVFTNFKDHTKFSRNQGRSVGLYGEVLHECAEDFSLPNLNKCCLRARQLRFAVEYAKEWPSFEWAALIDDDQYVVPPQLQAALPSSPDTPMFFGLPGCATANCTGFCGGAGIYFNRPAINILEDHIASGMGKGTFERFILEKCLVCTKWADLTTWEFVNEVNRRTFEKSMFLSDLDNKTNMNPVDFNKINPQLTNLIKVRRLTPGFHYLPSKTAQAFEEKLQANTTALFHYDYRKRPNDIHRAMVSKYALTYKGGDVLRVLEDFKPSDPEDIRKIYLTKEEREKEKKQKEKEQKEKEQKEKEQKEKEQKEKEEKETQEKEQNEKEQKEQEQNEKEQKEQEQNEKEQKEKEQKETEEKEKEQKQKEEKDKKEKEEAKVKKNNEEEQKRKDEELHKKEEEKRRREEVKRKEEEEQLDSQNDAERKEEVQKENDSPNDSEKEEAEKRDEIEQEAKRQQDVQDVLQAEKEMAEAQQENNAQQKEEVKQKRPQEEVQKEKGEQHKKAEERKRKEEEEKRNEEAAAKRDSAVVNGVVPPSDDVPPSEERLKDVLGE